MRLLSAVALCAALAGCTGATLSATTAAKVSAIDYINDDVGGVDPQPSISTAVDHRDHAARCLECLAERVRLQDLAISDDGLMASLVSWRLWRRLPPARRWRSPAVHVGRGLDIWRRRCRHGSPSTAADRRAADASTVASMTPGGETPVDARLVPADAEDVMGLLPPPPPTHLLSVRACAERPATLRDAQAWARRPAGRRRRNDRRRSLPRFCATEPIDPAKTRFSVLARCPAAPASLEPAGQRPSRLLCCSKASAIKTLPACAGHSRLGLARSRRRS